MLYCVNSTVVMFMFIYIIIVLCFTVFYACRCLTDMWYLSLCVRVVLTRLCTLLILCLCVLSVACSRLILVRSLLVSSLCVMMVCVVLCCRLCLTSSPVYTCMRLSHGLRMTSLDAASCY